MANIEHFQCSCIKHEHVVRIDFHPEDGEIVLSMFMDNRIGFFKRLYVAFCYIFKMKCPSFSQDSHWDCILLDKNKVKQLRQMIINFEIESELIKIRSKS